ncbi:MAG: ATP-binding protein, partial [Caulobacteraceae bacterium]
LYDVEYRTVGKEDGVVRWVAAKGRGIFGDSGTCVRVVGVAIDITQRKADEARLRELNETLERRIQDALAERRLLAEIIEAGDAFVQVLDPEFCWLAFNRSTAERMERAFGAQPRVGGSLLDALAHRPSEQASVRALWSRALAGEAFTEVETIDDPSSGRRCYEMRFSVLNDREGRRVGAYQIVNDVTERVNDQARLAEAEAALRQAQKLDALGQLTGGMAHDFNNLLTPIISSLDILQRRQVGGAREQRLIEASLQSAERAKVLVQRLLAFARQQPLRPVAVDVGKVVDGMAELIGGATGPQIKLVTDIAPDLPAAKADANQLEMALLNLSVNARDAMPAGGTLRISAHAETVVSGQRPDLPAGHYLRLSVADTGEGMEEAVLARAAEPFFSTKGVGKCTGLGLSMVHGLASQLGGALSIASRLDEGTTVDLWLPLSDEAPGQSEVQPPSGAARPAAGTVLLVDDEENVRLSTADMLTDLGYAVVPCASGEDAVDLVEQGLHVDLLVTDHLMPGLSGVEVARALMARQPAARVLVVSGFAELDRIDRDLPRMAKPFRQAELAARLTGLDRPEA